jgi:hypothetical protein
MKLLRASNEPGIIQRLQSILEDAGIKCILRNEFTAGLFPEVPASESTLELWIVDDQRLPQAQRVLADLKNSESGKGIPWNCSSCGEALEPQFTACWQCGTAQT